MPSVALLHNIDPLASIISPSLTDINLQQARKHGGEQRRTRSEVFTTTAERSAPSPPRSGGREGESGACAAPGGVIRGVSGRRRRAPSRNICPRPHLCIPRRCVSPRYRRLRSNDRGRGGKACAPPRDPPPLVSTAKGALAYGRHDLPVARYPTEKSSVPRGRGGEGKRQRCRRRYQSIDLVRTHPPLRVDTRTDASNYDSGRR